MRGEPYDTLWTVAVHDPGHWSDAVDECEHMPSAEKIAEHDGLSPADRQWFSDFRLRRLGDPGSVTEPEEERARDLARDDQRLAVFEGPRVCADDSSLIDHGDEDG